MAQTILFLVKTGIFYEFLKRGLSPSITILHEFNNSSFNAGKLKTVTQYNRIENFITVG